MMEPKNPVGAVENSLTILAVLRDMEGGSLEEITDQVDLTKGAVHNHLSTLHAHEYVVKDNGQYKLGIKFFEMGVDVRRKKEIYRIGVPEVDKLADETGELANILIEEHGRGVYLHRAQGEDALSLDTGVGARVFLHNTGLGKAILAHMPEEQVRHIVNQHGMTKTTENTITTVEGLFEELDEIRERGYALDMEERAEGIRCVAAPVIPKNQGVRGAISLAGPRGRLKGEYLNSTAPDLVTNAANVISINLAYA